MHLLDSQNCLLENLTFNNNSNYCRFLLILFMLTIIYIDLYHLLRVKLFMMKNLKFSNDVNIKIKICIYIETSSNFSILSIGMLNYFSLIGSKI